MNIGGNSMVDKIEKSFEKIMGDYQENSGHIKVKSRIRQEGSVQATPNWLTKEQKAAQISMVYREARKLTTLTYAWPVDQIWPLNGKTSCYLYVPWNLKR